MPRIHHESLLGYQSKKRGLITGLGASTTNSSSLKQKPGSLLAQSLRDTYNGVKKVYVQPSVNLNRSAHMETEPNN